LHGGDSVPSALPTITITGHFEGSLIIFLPSCSYEWKKSGNGNKFAPFLQEFKFIFFSFVLLFPFYLFYFFQLILTLFCESINFYCQCCVFI
jgi:hypothetical protein